MILRSSLLLACLLPLALAACNDTSIDRNAGIDGGADHGLDQSAMPRLLCASAACAAAPCTVGCVFDLVEGSCPPGSVSVAVATVSACAGFCEGFQSSSSDPTQPTLPGYCWRYDATLPGACQTPTCGWNSACEIESNHFDENQAVICPADEACYDGRAPGDLAPYCPDLAMPGDGGGGD